MDELTANLVDNGKLIVVDRSEIDLIRSEFDFQYSGEVGDDSMQALGRMLGAQSIISGSLTDMGGFYRIVIRVLNVQNASVEVQYRTNIVSDHVVAALLTGGKTNNTTITSSSRQTTQTAQTQAQQTVQVPTQPTVQTTGQSAVIVVEGASLEEKLQWLQANAVNNTQYSIILTSNESISSQTLSFSGRRNVTVKISGTGGERVISNTGRGRLFIIESGVTLILDNGVTLQGRSDNDAALVLVNSRGELIMNTGAKIIGNKGRGVSVTENAIFKMNGGEISGNTVDSNGGGIAVWGSFTMVGGRISNNTASNLGGGVTVEERGNFVMQGGEISDNTSNFSIGFGGQGGGGVYINIGATFSMSGGEIYGNTAKCSGGGVATWGGTFSMTGGEIAGNTASIGGGVAAGAFGDNVRFTKAGGIIYGSTGTHNDNRASQSGHAVGGNRIRNSTAGPSVRLDIRTSGSAGGWEN